MDFKKEKEVMDFKKKVMDLIEEEKDKKCDDCKKSICWNCSKFVDSGWTEENRFGMLEK
jgi:hypothetical protein